MKRLVLLILLIFIFLSIQVRAEKSTTNNKAFSNSSQNMQRQFDKSFAQNWGNSGPVLQAPPDMGGDIDGGGGTGIGREVLPVVDSVGIIFGLSFIYLLNRVYIE